MAPQPVRGSNYDSHHIADALDAYEVGKGASIDENVVTGIVWVLFARVPGLDQALGLPGATWRRRGGRGRGDVLLLDADEQLIAQVEVKGPSARVSFGSGCPTCTVYKSQFAHMAEAGTPVLTITTAGRRATAEAWMADAGLTPPHHRVCTVTDLATEVRNLPSVPIDLALELLSF